MGVTIQQWRAAIGKPGGRLKVKKGEEDHEDVVNEVGDNGRRLFATILVTILWLLLANWVVTLSVTEDVSSSERETMVNSSAAKEETILDDNLTLAVIKVLLIIGGVESNPGPEMMPKLNLYRLLRQIETSGDQMEFLREQNLLPRSIDCENCCKTLSKVYPQNNPEAKFKYFRCKCSNSKKVPITSNTFFYHSNITPKVFLVLAYRFCYR